MKAQMRFQKIMCLIMIIAGALGLLYAFCYLSGGMAELGQAVRTEPGSNGGMVEVSVFTASEGKYDRQLFTDIQPFNSLMVICGIVMIAFAVILYITASNSRRNYYVSNYIAVGLCSVGNIAISLVLMIFNAMWRAKFLNIDFEKWEAYYDLYIKLGADKSTIHYSESTLWFDIGFVVYGLIIIASVFLILNLVWKIKLMKGEKELLAKSSQLLSGGETV